MTLVERSVRRSVRWALRQPIPPWSAARSRLVATAAASVVRSPPPPPSYPSLDPSTPNRRQAIHEARPFSDFLTDNFNRHHDYLRISITERCNLRCMYCMPEEGVQLSPNENLLTTPEIVHLSSLFVSQGVTKIRLTGGEPTVRPDIVPLMRQIGSLREHGLRELALTTNGISLHRKLDDMVEAGLTGVNISLDTLDPFQFQIMTRRKGFEAVMKSIDKILDLKARGTQLKLKINCVVMRGINDREILPFVDFARDRDVEVRFIEYMPFDGNKWNKRKMVSYQEMLDTIREKYPDLQRASGHKNDTSKTWEIPGFVGKFGFITSMTHNFCGSCNRLRITSDGNLKVCLFGNSEVSLRDMIRKSDGNDLLEPKDRDAELLDVIGMAVKRKKEKHAGMGQLENMKNRPMILIDEQPPACVTAKPRTRLHPFHPTRPIFPSIPVHLLQPTPSSSSLRTYSTKPPSSHPSGLTHIGPTGAISMVDVSPKPSTPRLAIATGRVLFSNPSLPGLISTSSLSKGNVLVTAQLAGIQAAKRTADLIPLCHQIPLAHVHVDVVPRDEPARVELVAVASTTAATGVEMEALTAVVGAGLAVVDMCKALDKGMTIGEVRVVYKVGGRGGKFIAEGEEARGVVRDLKKRGVVPDDEER